MGLRLLVLVACACALVEGGKFKDHFPPDYLQAYYYYTNATVELSRLLVPEDATNVQLDNPGRHYALLVAFLQDVTFNLGKSCPHSYDKYYYKSLDNQFSKAFVNPAAVTARQNQLFREVDRTVHNVVEYLNSGACSGLTASECNQKVEDAANDNPTQYKHASETLLAVGDLARVFLNHTYESEAENYDVFSTLVKGKEQLKELVLSGVVVQQHLNGQKLRGKQGQCPQG